MRDWSLPIGAVSTIWMLISLPIWVVTLIVSDEKGMPGFILWSSNPTYAAVLAGTFYLPLAAIALMIWKAAALGTDEPES